MATCTTIGLMAAAAAAYFLAFVFTVVAYSIPWLLPRETYYSTVTSVGLIKSCFSKFKFASYIDKDQTVFDGCYQLNDAKFDYIKDYVRPDWFRQIQTMHFVCVIIMALAFLMICGFIAAYLLVRKQTAKRGRPWSSLLLAKAGCGLWFILVSIVAILQIVEPSMFYYNLERNRFTFYNGGSGGVPLNYSGGFALTIVSAVVCIVSVVCGVIIFAGIIRKTTILMGDNYVAKRIGAPSTSSMAASYASEKPFTVDVSKLDPSDEIIEKLSQDPEDRWSRNSRAGDSDVGSYHSNEQDRNGAGNISTSIGGRPAPAPHRSQSRSQSSTGRRAADPPDYDGTARSTGGPATTHSGRSTSPHHRSSNGGGQRRSTSTSPSRRSSGGDRQGDSHRAGGGAHQSPGRHSSSSTSDRHMMAHITSRASGPKPGSYTPKAVTPVAKNPIYTTPEPQIAKKVYATYTSY